MLDYNIEPLFERVFELRKVDKKTTLHFVSNWDNVTKDNATSVNFIREVYNSSSESSDKYLFAYEQFGLKAQILNYYQTLCDLYLDKTNIALTPGATQSINMLSKALTMLDRKRVLLLTPTYFATYYSLLDNGVYLSYYHLKDEHNYRIDFDSLKAIVTEQFINTIILTDPVYSSGIDCPVEDYKLLIELCSVHDIALIVDSSLGGLLWATEEGMLIPTRKLQLLKGLKDYAFVDSITKRLSLNGIKFSVLIGSESVIDKVDTVAESVYGGLSSVQCELMRKLYSPESLDFIRRRYKETIDRVKANNRVITSLLIDSDFELSKANSGYFATLNHKYYRLNEIDTEKVSLSLLNAHATIAITKDKLSYFGTNRFGFRVNLCQEQSELLLGVSQCIRINYEGFKHRQ